MIQDFDSNVKYITARKYKDGKVLYRCEPQRFSKDERACTSYFSSKEDAEAYILSFVPVKDRHLFVKGVRRGVKYGD